MLFASALTAVAIAFLLRWYMRRNWARFYVNPKSVCFPKVCPVCLNPANVIVEEDSTERVTANAIIFREVEWWTAKVPHCTLCQEKQVRNLVVGLSLAAICVIGLFIFGPKIDHPRDVIFYFFFAVPFYVVADNLHRGISLGKADGTVLPMRIRRSEYFDRMVALNSTPVMTDVPLAQNKGVWRH